MHISSNLFLARTATVVVSNAGTCKVVAQSVRLRNHDIVYEVKRVTPLYDRDMTLYAHE